MKKSLTLMLIAVIAVSSVFAASGYIGASSGYSFNYAKVSDDKTSQVSTSIPVNLDGATFFGKGSFNIGLSYGGKMASVPMTYKLGNTSVDADPADYKWTLAPYAGLAFQYRFSKGFALAGSVNATYNWESVTKTIAGQDLKGSLHTLGAMGNLYLNINLGSFNIRLGGLMEGPIGTWATGKAFGISANSDMIDSTGSFNVVPFVGIGFAY